MIIINNNNIESQRKKRKKLSNELITKTQGRIASSKKNFSPGAAEVRSTFCLQGIWFAHSTSILLQLRPDKNLKEQFSFLIHFLNEPFSFIWILYMYSKCIHYSLSLAIIILHIISSYSTPRAHTQTWILRSDVKTLEVNL